MVWAWLSVPALGQIQPANSRTNFYFAHIADGGPASDRWTTQFRFINPTPFLARGSLLFFSTNGGPLQVDFGAGTNSIFFDIPIAPNGSIQFETKGNSPTLRTGFVQGGFDVPIQATSEFRNWRNGIFANGASVDGIAPSRLFQTFADSFTGIAIANPNSFSVSCTGTFYDSNGAAIRERESFLGPFNQTAYTLGRFFSLPGSTVGSYFIDCSSSVVSLAIAGNDRGITSTLPSGAFAVPINHRSNIVQIFLHLVKALPAIGFSVGQPRLEVIV